MAHVVEETITITISRLVKGEDKVENLVGDELLATLESVAQELVGSAAVVEAEA